MSNSNDSYVIEFKTIVKWIFGGLVVLLAVIMGAIAAFKTFNRYQAVQDATNAAQVARINAENEQHVNQLRIAAQEQRVKIAVQEADIRREEAKGIKAAQDQISGTLTPLYVQMQLVEAMREIANSGKNNTVIYIPVGPNGLPVVSPVGGK